MIIDHRGNLYKKPGIRKVQSSIPKKEGSIHMNLGVLYSKKNVLQTTIAIWQSRLDVTQAELARIDQEIDSFELHILKNRDDAQVGKDNSSPNAATCKNTVNKIKIVEVEY